MRMTDTRENVLYVRMLGGFSVQWNGKLIAGGSKANNSQFAYLLQILIHNRDRGVTRDRLEELLFEDRDMSNIHHALQSVIYNAKKKLAHAGLPPVNYIEQRKGVFFWTKEIPLVEDAACFEELYRQAERAAKAEEEPEEPDADEQDEDFRAMMDGYEAFFDECAGFIEEYQNSADPMSMMSQYLAYVEKSEAIFKKINDIDVASLSEADRAYYQEVMSRIYEKLSVEG